MKEKKQKALYPGIKEAEAQKAINPFSMPYEAETPDFIGNAPNYEKFKNWKPERVLAFLNID